MDLKVFAFLLLFSACAFHSSHGYKILGIFPFFGESHMIMFKNIMKELAKRGHTVHVVSHYPLKKPMDNYVDMSLHGSIPLINNHVDFHYFSGRFDFLSLTETSNLFVSLRFNSKVMQAEAMRNLLNSTETYDLVITESHYLDATLGFVHKFKTPLVYVVTSCLYPWTSRLVANPQNPSYVPVATSSYSSRMSLWERVHNTLSLASSLLYWHMNFVPENDRLMREFFGDDLPPLLDIARNASLVLTNTHYSILGAKPTLPGVVEVAGVHVQELGKLPQDIEDFINNAPDGVIYFSMGSLLRGETLPDEKRDAFLSAFAKLKERVLWKYEDEDCPWLPDNVMVKKWMPQREILAHPKVKLFISHGGLFSLIEAVHEAVPIIGIPLFGDQKMNIRSLQSEGMSLHLRYNSITDDSVFTTIQEALKPKYAENAKRLSRLYHDRPMKPMDEAIYWIEHIIRHKGNPRLRSSAVNMPYYQYILIDVVAILGLVTLCILSILIYIFVRTVRFFKGKNSKKLKDQ